MATQAGDDATGQMPAPSIRRLGPDDAAAFRVLRLEALARHPEAFGASWEVEVEQPLARSEATLQSEAVFGAWRAGTALVGIAGLHRPDSPKLRHKGIVWGVYLRPEARGCGLGRALLDAVIGHAATCVEDVGLSVGVANKAAIRLYEAAGFVRYGVEARALKIADAYHDEILMILTLTSRGRA